jgi:hypothetical protein
MPVGIEYQFIGGLTYRSGRKALPEILFTRLLTVFARFDSGSCAFPTKTNVKKVDETKTDFLTSTPYLPCSIY